MKQQQHTRKNEVLKMTTWQTIKDGDWTIRKVENENGYIEVTFTTHRNWLNQDPTYIDVKYKGKNYSFLAKELAKRNPDKFHQIMEFIK